MSIATKLFDPAEYLTDKEAVAEYLDAAFATDDAHFIADALGVVARAMGMSDLARKAGVDRVNLYRALSEEGNPEFKTIVHVVKALGFHLTLAPASKEQTGDEHHLESA